MIHFMHVTKTYAEGWKALDDVSFKIGKGEFVFLTGHSGAGKTTILKHIYMDERPDQDRGGQVLVHLNQDLVFDSKNTPDNRIQELRRKIGIVFQDFKLLNDRNVFENIALALRIVGTSSDKINAKVYEAMALVGMSHRRSAMPFTLSGGEQQRVAIARAMVHNPYILLADEPTGNLDPDNAQEVFQIFKEINARGTAILMATHNPGFYLNNSLRRLVLSHGRLVNREIL
jgi:cell division transport system ATP-binding protein